MTIVLARNPDLLRKASAARRSTPAAPAWRGLPVDGIAAKTMVIVGDRNLVGFLNRNAAP
jgi:hypothetical protein